MSVISYPEIVHRGVGIGQTNHDVEKILVAGPASRASSISSPTPSVDMLMSESPEIWVAFAKNGCHYINKQPKAPNSEQQMYALQVHYHALYPTTERFIRRWIYCQIPTVQVGIFRETPTFVTRNGNFPREVHFDSLVKHHVLSTGLIRPETLGENGDIFLDFDVFDIKPMCFITRRSALCIGHAVDKKLLLWPLLLTCSVTGTVAVVVSQLTHSIGAGAEVGSLVGVLFGLVWTYLMWISG